MAQRAGTADLPLHSGRVPKWLADRMRLFAGRDETTVGSGAKSGVQWRPATIELGRGADGKSTAPWDLKTYEPDRAIAA